MTENRPFTQELTQYPVRAIVTDGVFEQVCVSEQDSTTAINIKKGILSQLQNSLSSNSTSMHSQTIIDEVQLTYLRLIYMTEI